MLKYTLIALSALSALSGCTKSDGPVLRKEPNIELIQDMMESPALKAQDFEPNDRTKGASRLPPVGTVPVGYTPYPYHQDPVSAAKNLKNPLAGQMTVEIINLGRTKYEIYCAVCHGYTGKGDGPVAPKMALPPPSLMSEKVFGLNDAAIYHIITDGQGVMGSYAHQLVHEKDRWAIVNYVRSLQNLAKGSSNSAAPGAASGQ